METDDERRAAFLVTLSETANVSESAKAAGVPRKTIYNWRKADSEFSSAWDEAVELGSDSLEDEATRRGKDGTRKPVFYKGRRCGYIREYSDTLLMFMLKAKRPDKFKDRISQEVSGPAGGPIITELVIEHHDASPEPISAPDTPAITETAGGSDQQQVAPPVPPGPVAGVA